MNSPGDSVERLIRDVQGNSLKVIVTLAAIIHIWSSGDYGSFAAVAYTALPLDLHGLGGGRPG